MARLICFCCVVLTPNLARPETKIFIDQVAPLAYSENGLNKGLLSEMLAEMARRVGHRGAVTPLPLMRLRVTLKADESALGTLWRVPELEPSYRWWVKLLDSRFYMFANADSTFDISHIEAAKNLRVGVILGSPAELMARRLGFRDVQTSTTPDSIVKKLALKRIDVWIATPRVLNAVFQRQDKPMPPPRISEEIGRLGLYLASSPKFPKQEADRWLAALESMKKDGSYDAIMMKYPDKFKDTYEH